MKHINLVGELNVVQELLRDFNYFLLENLVVTCHRPSDLGLLLKVLRHLFPLNHVYRGSDVFIGFILAKESLMNF